MINKIFAYLVIYLICIITLEGLQLNNNWQWAKKIEGSNLSYLSSSNDNLGNTIVTGTFSNQIFFETTSLQCQGNENLFIAKLDNSGTLEWARQFSDFFAAGSNAHRVRNISIKDNYIYVLVECQFPLSVDQIQINSHYGDSALGACLLKFNSNGICVWGKIVETSNPYYVNISTDFVSICTDGIILAKSIQISQVPIILGNFSITGYNDGDSSDTDILVSKMDFQGNFVWAACFGGASDEILHGICVDEQNNVYLGGTFEFTMIANTTQLISYGFKDIFILKLNSQGALIWAQKAGSVKNDTLKDIKYYNGNLLIAGEYVRLCTFGTLLLDTFYPNPNLGCTSVYIASISCSGNWNFVNRVGFLSDFASMSVSNIAVNSNLYILINWLQRSQSNPMILGDDTQYLPDIYNVYPSSVFNSILSLNISSNIWNGASCFYSYVSLCNSLYVTDNSVYVGTKVFEYAYFPFIYIETTTNNCYAFAKISKSEIVDNIDYNIDNNTSNSFRLYPNPSSIKTGVVLRSETNNISQSQIEIYNVKGQLVKRMSNLDNKSELSWDLKDNDNKFCTSGIYICTVKSGALYFSKKLIIIN